MLPLRGRESAPVCDALAFRRLSAGWLTAAQTLVYDTDGRPVFNGGITGSRGHRGDNPGRAALIAAIDGARDQRQARVFGCSLFESAGGIGGGQ